MSLERDVAQWLGATGPLSRAPVELERDREVWREQPVDLSCYCCGGSGLVHGHVIQRFADPSYDPVAGTPVRCTRSRICGWEKVRAPASDGDGMTETRRQRWEQRVELPVVPRHIADAWDKVLRDEARALAMRSPDEKAARFDELRRAMTNIGRRMNVPDHDDTEPGTDAEPAPGADGAPAAARGGPTAGGPGQG